MNILACSMYLFLVVLLSRQAGAAPLEGGDELQHEARLDNDMIMRKKNVNKEAELASMDEQIENNGNRLVACEFDESAEGSHFQKRFVLTGNKFEKNVLRYFIKNYPSEKSIASDDVDVVFDEAFMTWAGVANLTFIVDSGMPDINIRFGPTKHDCSQQFGANSLSHVVDKEIHLRDSANWCTGLDDYDGASLYQVATNEIGHVLGLQHNPNSPDSAMNPYISSDPKYALNADDIAGIQALYGPSQEFLQNMFVRGKGRNHKSKKNP